MASIIKNKGGFTLSEILITITILIILSGVVFSIIINSYQAVNEQKAYIDLQQEGARAMGEITKITNLALAVTNYPESSPTYFSDDSNLVLKVNSIDINNDIVADHYDYFIFYLNDNKLLEKIIADPASTGRTSKTITEANFVKKAIFGYNTTTNTSASLVYITLITGKEVNGREKEIILQSSAFLRNF